MANILVIVVIFTMLSAVTPVKEWKNFENGKVYSHKMPTDKQEIQNHGLHKTLAEEGRLLHSRHRDKKMKTNSLQTTEVKLMTSKIPGRHHKMSVEEEMHLRPLKERHHKFPNPALLIPVKEDNPTRLQIGKQNFVKKTKHPKQKNDRINRGRRDKRPRSKETLPVMMVEKSAMSTPFPNIDATAQYSLNVVKNFFDP